MRSSFMGAVASLSFLLVGCAGQADISLALGTTDELALSIEENTDAAAGAELPETALLLHVLGTEVHVAPLGAGNDANEASSDDGDAPGAEQAGGEGAGFVVLSEQARDLDLYALRGSAEEIASGAVPAGRLTQIRLILDAGQPATLVVDGERTPVAVPSGAEAGLKLYAAPPVLIENGAEVNLGVNFGGLVERGAGGLVLSPALALTVSSGPIPEGAGRPAP